jgi:cytochrome c oxidase subunit I+III
MTPPVRDVDVSDLPDFAFGPAGLIWWGTLGFMVIEATMFVVAFVAYFYLRLQSDEWPPSQPYPALLEATLNLVVLLVSCIPNELARRAAERFDLRGVRRWLTVTLLIGVASLVLRVFEYPALNTRWDSNAYGAITWLVLSLHTFHLITDVTDSVVLAVLAHTGPIEEQRFVDFSENALYWYFIVASFVPVYLIVYFGPRWL